MAVKNIVTNEEKLSLVSFPVVYSQEVLDIANDLVDTAKKHAVSGLGCVGLACNQIGIFKRIITVYYGGEWVVMINPKIVESWAGRFNAREACLSRPGKNVSKARFKKIRVDYIDINGHEITQQFTKFTARVVQHEVDHLNGLYI